MGEVASVGDLNQTGNLATGEWGVVQNLEKAAWELI